ncbi:MAG: hypothetical protein PHE24_03635 [Patescibacteria group bacterium]|nr:hypothetical protein [Patescibacteria group bacterium]
MTVIIVWSVVSLVTIIVLLSHLLPNAIRLHQAKKGAMIHFFLTKDQQTLVDEWIVFLVYRYNSQVNISHFKAYADAEECTSFSFAFIRGFIGISIFRASTEPKIIEIREPAMPVNYIGPMEPIRFEAKNLQVINR